jgi:hypothetical protein
MMKRLAVLGTLVLGLVAAVAGGPYAYGLVESDATDPARNTPLPCEALTTSTPPRSANGIAHLANLCGFVGTDVEFQSRTDQTGKVHDYAFVGTMGDGLRIFDVTDAAHPEPAGGYIDQGWENDVQVRGNIAVLTFDGVAGEGSTTSTCLRERYGEVNGQGVDIMRLNYNALTAKFEVNLLTCVANPPGGAHNATLHQSGNWLGISNPSSDWALDVIDLRGIESGASPVHRYRLIDASRQSSAGRCPAGATFKCIVMTQPNGSSASGLWRPHDVFFSKDGGTAYVAALNSTFIVDVSQVLTGKVRTIAVIPNESGPGGLTNPENIQLSHQADITPDGKILIVNDERGGGLDNTECNTDPNGVIGAIHFWALGSIKGAPQSKGASPATPKKLGIYINPNPTLLPDPLQPAIDLLPRAERGCTSHVFRIGGNGSVSAGPIAPGFDGVSSLGQRELVEAWYGAGVWNIDFSGPSRNDDGQAEDSRSTWGNTLGWNVMPGADTWSAKEYKGNIFAGDILRGFDVYTFDR